MKMVLPRLYTNMFSNNKEHLQISSYSYWGIHMTNSINPCFHFYVQSNNNTFIIVLVVSVVVVGFFF